MRYVCSAAATVIAILTVAPAAVSGASNLSITNYQLVSDQRATLTQWYVTFKADLVNTGPALSSVTATITSLSSRVQVVAGQGRLHFNSIPAGGRVTSADTFTLLVDRSATFDWSQVEWSFTNPVANAGPNQTAPVTAVVTLDGSASSNPIGVGTLSYSWALQSIPPGSRATLSRPDTVSPSFVVDAAGTYRCQLTVTNGLGSDVSTVTVSTVNSPPVAVAGSNQTVALGAAVTLNGSRSSDVDGDPLTYSWSFVSLPSKSAAVLLGGQTVLPSFVADAPGTYIVQLVVRDGKVDSLPSTVMISTANTPPVANAGSNQTVTAGMFVQLNGSASTDVDGDALTYRWSFNSLPPGSTAVLSSPTAVNPTFTADKAGTYIVQLIVNDGKVDSAASTVTITTNAVQAPTARAGSDVTVHAGTTVQLSGSGTDPQGFAFTYSWSLPTRPPTSTASLSATNIQNPTFVADLPGIYAAQLVVNNGVLSSAPSTVTITTTNTAPVADPGPSQSVYTGDTVYLDGSRSSDADNDPITAFSWSFTSRPSGSNAVLSGLNTKTPTFVADVAGPYVVQLIVSDQFASSQAKTVLISVGTRTIAVTPNPLGLYNSPRTLNITLSPTPTSPVSVSLSAETPGVVSFSPNPATVPANSSGVNVTVTPISPGTTNFTASATGYYASTGAITVTKPTISIALAGGAAAVGLTHKLGGSITLNAPAPPGGTTVTLSSNPTPDGAVSFDSNTVTIPEGGTTGAFGITGARTGAATINAVASGYNSGVQTVQVVMLGSVSLPDDVTVGSGRSAPLNIQISSPAPADGVTVTFTSSDPGKVTVTPSSVVIKPGATAPDTPPQVNGAALVVGDATVTATAGGFHSDSQNIRVIASITFADQAVSVGPGGVKSFTILLSAPAPAGGLLVYLTSSNESVATVPVAGALIPAGQQSIDSQVSGVAVGTAEITPSTNPSIPGNQYFSGAGAVLRVTVARPSIRITTESLPAGTAGGNYPATTLAATGGTGLGYFWTIPVGSLPAGLNLNTSGVLSGSLASTATTSTFTVQVQDSGGNKDTKTFTITVTSPITITTESLPVGVAGASYPSSTLAASGGTGAGYSWSLASGALPSGLTLSAAGVISGTLSSSAATSTFTVQVQDSGTNTTTKQFTITINAPLSITTTSLPVGTAGAEYPATTLAASGGTGSGYTWTLATGSLPSGLILSTAGVITGSLSSSATATTFTVRVKDSGNNAATKEFTITVNAALSITTASLPNGMAGADYTSTTLAATGGSGSGYSWSVSAGSLPSGLTLSAAGVLSGALSASAATSTFTIRVQDSEGAATTKQFTATIYPALTITTASLPAGTAGGTYPPKFLAASGGSGIGYVWSVSEGSLPEGLTFTTAGLLSGTLSNSATTSTFTIQVKDSANNIGSKQFTLTVNAALVITTASLPDGTGGAAYTPTTLAASGGSGTGYTWSVSVGSLPSGLSLSSGGVLSGTLAANAISSTFTIQAQDDAGNKATKQFSISVTLTVTTASLPAADAGKSYSALLTAAGGTGTGYAWTVSAGSLPSGVTLSSLGVLSGTVSNTATTSTFTVQVQDSGATTATKQFTITVNPALNITTASVPVGTAGVAYPSTTLAANGGTNAGYTWSISVGSLPSGLSLSAAGVISGTLSSSAVTSTFTVQVHDSGGNIATKQFTLTVETVLTVATASLPNGAVGASYPATTLAAGGGTGTGYTWSITVGSLPAGLTLSSGGVISGTLSSSAATSTFTVQVQDSGSHTATKQFTITVNPALAITTSSLPTGTAGSVYPSTTLAASGGSGTGYTWSVTVGLLPSGLTLSAAGVLSGTLSSSAATSTFTVRVQDSDGVSATKQFTVTVNPALTITTATLPTGTAAASYPSTTLAASGGTGTGYAWSVTVGSLPAGLTLSAGGVLSGALSSSATTSTFTVQVQDSGSNIATKQFTITVNPALTITTASLPGGIAGNAYPSTTLAASGGTGAGYSWSVSSGSLPSGLTLTSAGVLSGTLATSATSTNVTIQVQDSGGNTATQAFSIGISAALSIGTASLPDGIAGTAYTPTTLAASGGTGTGYSWSVSIGGLPSGLTLSTAGVLSGTLASTATSSTFTIQVKDSGNNTAVKQFTITVAAGLGVFTALLPDGIAGTAYGPATLTATGGTGAGYTWSVSVGSLPAGLTLSAAGVLSGTLSPSATTSTFTVQVKDSGNNIATREFTLTVKPVLSIAAVSLPAGTAGSPYPSTTLSASGGTGNGYSWSVSIGSLPSGLTLSAAGVISGTLSASAATSTFTVQVQDSGSNTATRQFTITVNPAVQITTATLPAGTAGSAYPATTLAASGGSGAGYTWSVAIGSLPSGLTLSTGGVLSGTLSNSATTSTFTIQAQDNAGNTGRKQFTLTVTLAVTTGALPGGTAGTPYAGATLAASGGTGAGYTWSLASGLLPAGLTLNSAGVISGSLLGSATTSTFTVQVQDSGGATATRQLTITVGAALTINTASLPTGTAGAVYPSTTLSASGGSGSGYTWSITVGSLPSGLTLSAGGVLSGTLSSSATTSTFTIQVQDSSSNTTGKQFTVTVNPALTITTASLPTGTAGMAYTSTTLAASGGTGSGYSWSVTVGSLPSGLTLSAAGVLSGTLSSSAASATFSIQVQDSGSNTTAKQFTITVHPALSITTASLPTGTAGSAYPSTTLAASGGTGTGYLWSVSVGSLPSGLTLSAAGVISGTLSGSATTATFTVQVLDSGSNTATKQFTLTVNPALTITTASLPIGTAGTAYPSSTLAATGGTGTGYSWSVTVGSLPSGLTLSAAGVISGTLSGLATGTVFTVQVQDSGGNLATKQLGIIVNPTLSITATPLPTGIAGDAYPSTTLAATGGTGAGHTWSVTVGSLPSGLTLSAAGVISGTLSGSATTQTFTVQVQDSGLHTAPRQFTIAVNAALTITTASLPTGTAGSAYPSTTLAASGGTGAGYAWSVTAGSLPSGLTLSAAGVISGTLSGLATTQTFTVQVRDSGSNTVTKQFTLTVNPALSITTASLPNGMAGAAYTSTTLAATGGTGAGYAWSVTVGSLPAGLTLSAAGVISGTLSGVATTQTFTVQVQDNGGNTATKPFTLTVNPLLSITTASLPSGMAGSAYSSTTLAASGGTGAGYAWSVTVGSLPAGLTLSAAGVISGTLSGAATTQTFTVQVQDNGGNATTKQFTVTVYPTLVITTASLPTGTAGSAYPSTTLAASGGAGTGYTWSVTVGSLPTGLTLSAAGVISGTLSGSATTQTFTVRVQDSGANTIAKQFTLTVNPALSITTASVPSGLAGSAYPSTTLAASGGTGTGYTWSVTVGSLPTGLTLSAAGVISGTLSGAATTQTFTVQVQDSGSNTATKQFTLTVGPPLSITTPSLPGGMAGSAYPSTTLAASGGTGTGYTWSVTVGSLPTGLTLSAAGVISGTLSGAATTQTFTVQVQDSGSHTITKQFIITVLPALSITTASLPTGTAGSGYPSTTLAASGGTGTGYTWSVTAGSLPTGLTLSAAGVISGTLSGLATTQTFTVQVQDSGANTITKQFTLTVNPALSITTASLPNGLAGAAYTSTTLAATGGTGAGYAWSVTVGSLPAGLTLSAAGVISGTLSGSATTQTFTVQVQDSGSNTATKQFAITVSPTLSITTASLPAGVAGAAYPSTTLAASGGTGAGYTWSVTVGVLPSGLILSTAGVISGTVSALATSSTFTVQVKDGGNNTATREFTLTVNPAVTISTASLPVGVAGNSYTATLAASGGTGAGYTWSVTVGSLPTGLTLSEAGVISGTLSSLAVSSTFTVQAKDNGNNTGIKQFTLTVNPALSLGGGSLPNGMAGAAYPTTTLAASGGTGAGYTWSVTAGSLPTGLTLSAAGVISGTLSGSATTQTFTVQVQDSGSNTAARDFTIVVLPALGITTGSLPGGTAGTAYTSTTLAASGGTGSGYTWSITVGSLPSGLTLSSAGVISGTLSFAAVSSTFTVQVKDSNNNTATKPFTIAVAAAPLVFTTGPTLPNATVGTLYNTSIVAVGGTLPYTWSASGLPAWLTLDTNGFTCGGVGNICGTPPIAGPVSFTITVTDSTSPTHQSISQLFNLAVTGPGGLGTITVPNVSIGVNLQAPITITLSPVPPTVTVVTITSGNPGVVLLGNLTEGGVGSVVVPLAAGASVVQVFAKALAASSPVTISVTADAGYSSGSGSVTISPSGLLLSGPNGIGNDFTTFQGVTTGLTVYPYRLGAGNVPVENQSIRGGLTVNAPIGVSPSTIGTMGSPTVAVNAGDLSGSALFTASNTNTGNASITVTPPSGFTTPATGGTLNVSVQTSGFIPPSGVTVGRNLQTAVSVGLNGPAANNTVVTIQSSDPTNLKFATSLNGAGAGTIQVTIAKNFSSSPIFYARGYGSAGSVPYTISAATYGTVTTSMPLGPSGFVINTPTGQGQNFSVTLGGPDPTLDVLTALFDAGGNPLAIQAVSPDVNVTATVTSFSPSVGTVSPTLVQVLGGTTSRSFTFHAVALGSTNITATASGYTGASVTATVSGVSVFLNPVGSVGQFLAAPGLVNLSSPAVSNVPVTVTVASGPIKLAVNKTDPGSNSITVTVTPGSTNAAFWVFGLASSGAGTYTASALGSTSAPDTVALAPSGVAIYMGAPGNPSCFGTNPFFACTIALATGARTVYAVTYQLLSDGSNAINGQQPLAGNVALTVPLSNSNPSVGSIPGSVSIAGGTSSGSFTFTPSSLGSTVVSINGLAGWTAPTAVGFDLTQLGITVL